MQNPQSVSDKIKETAKRKNVSIGKMLADCGLSKNTLSSMQSGGFLPRTETLTKIADYLDCSVDYLLGRTDNPQKTTSAIDEYLARIEAKEPNQAIIMHRNEKGGQEVIQLSEERLQRILKIIDLMDNEDKKQ